MWASGAHTPWENTLRPFFSTTVQLGPAAFTRRVSPASPGGSSAQPAGTERRGAHAEDGREGLRLMGSAGMSILRRTFLGTSAAQPTLHRNLSGLAVKANADLLLFDCGEGSQRQMVRFGTGFTVGAG